jgi:DNA-binding transcriptional LysR family regulator
MDRFRELSVLVAVAEEGAFNAAARRLNLSPPAVTRLVGALEARIGARLLTRTTRRVAPTEAGTRLLADAVRILAELDGAEASAAGAHRSPRGVLRVTAPVMFGQRYIAPILREFLDAYPEVSAATLFVDRVVDLIDEGLDVALRIGDLPDSALSAVRIGAVRRVTVAAPGYLAAHGVPATPDDLAAGHRIVQPVAVHPAPRWSFVAGARSRTVEFAPRLAVNTMTAAIEAAAAGWGITRVLSYQVADALADGTLIEILRDWEDRGMPVHLVHSEGRRPAAKVRAFVDLAARRLRADAGRLAAG